MDHFDTLNIVVKSVEKFLEVLKKISFKIDGFEKWNSDLIQITLFWRDCFFGGDVFFRRPLEIFLRTLRLCKRYLKGSPKVILYASKKNMVVRPAQKMSRDTIFLNKFLDNKIPNDFFSKSPCPPPACVTWFMNGP